MTKGGMMGRKLVKVRLPPDDYGVVSRDYILVEIEDYKGQLFSIKATRLNEDAREHYGSWPLELLKRDFIIDMEEHGLRDNNKTEV